MSEGQVVCYDCGLPYAGDHWVEAVVAHDIWRQISPTGDEGGILCISCMAARLAQRGLSNVPVKLTAGPFTLDHTLEPRIEQLEREQGWQDIATAPKDGTPILIWQPDAGFGGDPRSKYMPPAALRDGEFSYRGDDPRLLRYDDARWAIGYWRPWGGWGNRNSATVTPTHWRPLPEPPAIRNGERG